MRKIKQLDDGQMVAYINDMEALCKRINSNMLETKLVRNVMKDFKPSIARYVSILDDCNLEELKRNIQKYEMLVTLREKVLQCTRGEALSVIQRELPYDLVMMAKSYFECGLCTSSLLTSRRLESSVDQSVDSRYSSGRHQNNRVEKLYRAVWSEHEFVVGKGMETFDQKLAEYSSRAARTSSSDGRTQHGRQDSTIVVSTHDDHIHVTHTCPNTNGACRCAWWKASAFSSAFLRRELRRRSRVADLTESDWKVILGYFSGQGRTVVLLVVGGRPARTLLRTEAVPLSRNQECGKEGTLEAYNSSFEGHEPPELRGPQLFEKIDESDVALDQVERGRLQMRTEKKKRLTKENIRSASNELLRSHTTSPPHCIFRTPEYFNNELFNDLHPQIILATNAIDKWCGILNHWSMEDYELFYSNPLCTPYINAYQYSIHNAYYSVEYSLIIVNSL
ncbi:uncharacterized protein LOC126894711 [Daktulosphaira vitifoliae]|uniref:uncharacterized protein LOC126894711 n=1 Tax=Daktulosphaira vitifoliae TaxID=58002 RepID=UPI0021AAC2B7|nr:uncharacterized protein LOC126894711 [Daktulosphaira vitifoliae]